MESLSLIKNRVPEAEPNAKYNDVAYGNNKFLFTFTVINGNQIQYKVVTFTEDLTNTQSFTTSFAGSFVKPPLGSPINVSNLPFAQNTINSKVFISFDGSRFIAYLENSNFYCFSSDGLNWSNVQTLNLSANNTDIFPQNIGIFTNNSKFVHGNGISLFYKKEIKYSTIDSFGSNWVVEWKFNTQQNQYQHSVVRLEDFIWPNCCSNSSNIAIYDIIFDGQKFLAATIPFKNAGPTNIRSFIASIYNLFYKRLPTTTEINEHITTVSSDLGTTLSNNSNLTSNIKARLIMDILGFTSNGIISNRTRDYLTISAPITRTFDRFRAYGIPNLTKSKYYEILNDSKKDNSYIQFTGTSGPNTYNGRNATNLWGLTKGLMQSIDNLAIGLITSSGSEFSKTLTTPLGTVPNCANCNCSQVTTSICILDDYIILDMGVSPGTDTTAFLPDWIKTNFPNDTYGAAFSVFHQYASTIIYDTSTIAGHNQMRTYEPKLATAFLRLIMLDQWTSSINNVNAISISEIESILNQYESSVQYNTIEYNGFASVNGSKWLPLQSKESSSIIIDFINNIYDIFYKRLPTQAEITGHFESVSINNNTVFDTSIKARLIMDIIGYSFSNGEQRRVVTPPGFYGSIALGLTSVQTDYITHASHIVRTFERFRSFGIGSLNKTKYYQILNEARKDNSYIQFPGPLPPGIDNDGFLGRYNWQPFSNMNGLTKGTMKAIDDFAIGPIKSSLGSDATFFIVNSMQPNWGGIDPGNDGYFVHPEFVSTNFSGDEYGASFCIYMQYYATIYYFQIGTSTGLRNPWWPPGDFFLAPLQGVNNLRNFEHRLATAFIRLMLLNEWPTSINNVNPISENEVSSILLNYETSQNNQSIRDINKPLTTPAFIDSSNNNGTINYYGFNLFARTGDGSSPNFFVKSSLESHRNIYRTIISNFNSGSLTNPEPANVLAWGTGITVLQNQYDTVTSNNVSYVEKQNIKAYSFNTLKTAHVVFGDFFGSPTKTNYTVIDNNNLNSNYSQDELLQGTISPIRVGFTKNNSSFIVVPSTLDSNYISPNTFVYTFGTDSATPSSSSSSSSSSSVCRTFGTGYVINDMLDASNGWSIGIIGNEIKIIGDAFNNFNNLDNNYRQDLPANYSQFGPISNRLQQIPLNLNNPRQVFAGKYTAYVTNCQNMAYAWGDNSNGQTTLPVNNNIKKIVGNDFAGLALKTNGTCIGWGTHTWSGWNNSNENIANRLINIVDIDAGPDHFLALNTEGNILAWGLNEPARTISNLPNSIQITTPVTIFPFAFYSGMPNFTYFSDSKQISVTNFKKISAGNRFSLGLTENRQTVSWGLGYNNQNIQNKNLNIENKYLDIDAGYYHGLGITESFNINIWGGTTGSSDSVLPNNNQGVGNGVFSIAAGAFHNVIYRTNFF
jgi:alpha-tubulin suppressor-like RCC1 family protein